MAFEGNSALSIKHWCGIAAAIVLALMLPFSSVSSAADEPGVDGGEVQRQLNQIKTDESRQRERVEQDEQLIRQLERELDQLQSQHVALTHKADALTVTSEKLKADTAQL